MVMNLDLTFRVNNEVAIVVSVIDLNAHVDLTLTGANLTSKVNAIKIDQCSARDSQIGDFDAESFRDFFNVAVRIAMPFLNEIIEKKTIQFPTTFMNLI